MLTGVVAYTNVYCYYCSVFIEKCVYIYHVSSSLVVVPIYIPSVVYGLRLFIVVVQGLSNCLHVCMIRVRVCYHITFFCSTPAGF